MTKHVSQYFEKENETSKAKFGTEKRPIVVRVQNERRAEEVLKICDEHGWYVSVELDPEKPEDVSALDQLLHPPEPMRTEAKVGRNDPCPCGSGLKYKLCCGK